MRITIKLALIALFVFGFFSFSATPVSAQRTCFDKNSTISGHVYDTETGVAVRTPGISIHIAEPGSPALASAITDSNGEFSFTGLKTCFTYNLFMIGSYNTNTTFSGTGAQTDPITAVVRTDAANSQIPPNNVVFRVFNP